MKITLTKKGNTKATKLIFVTKSGKNLNTKKLDAFDKALLQSAEKSGIFSGELKSTTIYLSLIHI